MPVFSFTAPHITAEEEKEERDQLTVEVRHQLHYDLFGQHPQQHDGEKGMVEGTDDIMIMSKRQEFEEELSNTPEDRLKDYLEVQRRAPQLIQQEADPVKFLRCEKYNVPAAVRRMLLYWKTRRKVFGDDCAFQPMTLNGAMKEDCRVIQSGILSILPNDAHGRAVLFFDRIRAIPPLASRESVVSF
jgi:hypothetical protein